MIDLTQARELLLRAVETQGREFVYNPGNTMVCRYEPYPVGYVEYTDRAPYSAATPCVITGCLIGVALTLAGETRHIDFRGSVGPLAESYPDMMTEEAVSYFHWAQRAQDNGGAWGDAYDLAEQSLTTVQ